MNGMSRACPALLRPALSRVVQILGLSSNKKDSSPSSSTRLHLTQPPDPYRWHAIALSYVLLVAGGRRTYQSCIFTTMLYCQVRCLWSWIDGTPGRWRVVTDSSGRSAWPANMPASWPDMDLADRSNQVGQGRVTKGYANQPNRNVHPIFSLPVAQSFPII
jgi:hypothetical protein